MRSERARNEANAPAGTVYGVHVEVSRDELSTLMKRKAEAYRAKVGEYEGKIALLSNAKAAVVAASEDEEMGMAHESDGRRTAQQLRRKIERYRDVADRLDFASSHLAQATTFRLSMEEAEEILSSRVVENCC